MIQTPPQKIEIPNRDDIYLRLIAESDLDELTAFVEVNRNHLSPWQTWAKDATRESLDAKNKEHIAKITKNIMLQYRIIERPHDDLVGTVTLYNHDEQKAETGLGYWVAQDRQGKGYAYAASGVAINYAFNVWKVNRVKLEINPENERSKVLAKRLSATLTEETSLGPVVEHPTLHEVWEIKR